MYKSLLKLCLFPLLVLLSLFGYASEQPMGFYLLENVKVTTTDQDFPMELKAEIEQNLSQYYFQIEGKQLTKFDHTLPQTTTLDFTDNMVNIDDIDFSFTQKK